jgi:hypothetical protein
MGCGIDVEDGPAGGRMTTANIKLDAFQGRLSVNVEGVLPLPPHQL